jgi:inner membrane protein
VLELLSGRRVHPIQYIFVGIAIVIFYVLLLSLSEHIGFSAAYLAASLATGVMISAYVGMAMESLRRGLTMLGIFGVLFSLLYMILQLEDYALLAGSIAGFVLLTATMFATLRVNWSGNTEEVRPTS